MSAVITCAECGVTYEAPQPSRHAAPCGVPCVFASGVAADGGLAPSPMPLPSEMHCPPMTVFDPNGAYTLPGRCPRGCYR